MPQDNPLYRRIGPLNAEVLARIAAARQALSRSQALGPGPGDDPDEEDAGGPPAPMVIPAAWRSPPAPRAQTSSFPPTPPPRGPRPFLGEAPTPAESMEDAPGAAREWVSHLAGVNSFILNAMALDLKRRGREFTSGPSMIQGAGGGRTVPSYTFDDRDKTTFLEAPLLGVDGVSGPTVVIRQRGKALEWSYDGHTWHDMATGGPLIQ